MKRGNVQVSRETSTGARGDRKQHKRAKLAPAEPEFQKLNQSDPVHARRIQQRRRMIAKGKNTIGYDEYIRKIPRNKRKPRSMVHPRTPDHTLDIPNKRWQGLVRAWRRALHQYDPPDLMKAFNEAANDKPKEPEKDAAPLTVQDKQLSEAVEKGLPVDVSPERSVVSPASPNSDDGHDQYFPQVDVLDQWESKDDGDDFLIDDVDSDDDLI